MKLNLNGAALEQIRKQAAQKINEAYQAEFARIASTMKGPVSLTSRMNCRESCANSMATLTDPSLRNGRRSWQRAGRSTLLSDQHANPKCRYPVHGWRHFGL